MPTRTKEERKALAMEEAAEMENPPGQLEPMFQRWFGEKGKSRNEAIVLAQAEYNCERDMKIARQTKVAPPWIAEDVQRRKVMGLPFEQALEVACREFVETNGYEPLISADFQEHRAGVTFTNLD